MLAPGQQVSTLKGGVRLSELSGSTGSSSGSPSNLWHDHVCHVLSYWEIWIFHCKHSGHTAVGFVLQINLGTCFSSPSPVYFSYCSHSEQRSPSPGTLASPVAGPTKLWSTSYIDLKFEFQCSRHACKIDTTATSTGMAVVHLRYLSTYPLSNTFTKHQMRSILIASDRSPTLT